MEYNKTLRMPTNVRQGAIYYVNFPVSIGSVQAGMRPVIITSSDIRNRTAPTVIVLIITSQIKKLYLKEHVVLPKLKWLPKVSMAEAEQRATVDKSQLIEYCGRLSYEEFKNVHRALRFIEGTNREEYERVY